MTKLYRILFIVLTLLRIENVGAQCSGDDSLIYGFNDPDGVGAFTGFLCSGVDSVGTTGANGYYNGDGYVINLVQGTQVIFSVDNCNSSAVSLTIADSLKNVIPGAYAAAACPNSLNFTATYTGTYIVFINLDGICGVFGNTLLGQANVKIQPGSQIPACPVANVLNDTICGAIPLTINSTFVEGNTSEAFQSDPLDAYVSSLGFVCSPPNNTLWYSFTAPSNYDTLNIWFTSKPGGGFHSWLGIFNATDPNNSCTGGLVYKNCVEGPDDNSGMDTINFSLTGIIAGQVYYFLIDGYNGDVGEFSIAIKTLPFLNSVDEISSLRNFSIFPNPAKKNVQITSLNVTDVRISILNSVGELIFENRYPVFSTADIDLSNFNPGFYIVKIDNSKSSVVKKLMIID